MVRHKPYDKTLYRSTVLIKHITLSKMTLEIPLTAFFKNYVSLDLGEIIGRIRV